MARFDPARRIGTRRKKRRRVRSRPLPWDRQHSPYTIEGRIEDAGLFARGLKQGPHGPLVRWVGIGVACLVVVLLLTLMAQTFFG